MPISRAEFESGQILTELEKRVIAFLEKDRTHAYTSNEIMDGINFQTDFSNFIMAILSAASVLQFPTFLNNLVTKGKIRMNIINREYYYMAK